MKLFKRSSVLASVLGALLGLASLSLVANPAQAADLNCSSGSYNQRITTTGACAWGNVRKVITSTNYSVTINMVVVDNANDGTFAAFDYHTCKAGVCGSYQRVATANGYNTSKPAQKTVNFGAPIPANVLYYVQIRVCASGKSCSSWKTAP